MNNKKNYSNFILIMTLFQAIRDSNLNLFNSLLEQGFNVNEIQFDGNTCLRAAIWHNQIKMVKLLIDHGANINTKSNGDTPLHLAVRYNRVEIIKILLKNGANINIKDKYGNTPLMEVVTYGNNIMLLLLQNGADVNVRNKNGWTPLFRVSIWGDIDSMEILLNWGANPLIKTNDNESIFDIENPNVKQFIQFYIIKLELLCLWEL